MWDLNQPAARDWSLFSLLYSVFSAMPSSAAARGLDLTESALRQCVRDAEREARRSGALSTGERKELEQLRRENRTLRMGRDILKKVDRDRSSG